MNFFCKLNKRTLKSFLVIHVVFSFIFLCTGTVISGHLPALAVYCIQRKKKVNRLPTLVDNPCVIQHFGGENVTLR